MSGRIIQTGSLPAKDGSVWDWEVVRWAEGSAHTEGELTIRIYTPNDPEHALYGEQGPEFTLKAILQLVGDL